MKKERIISIVAFVITAGWWGCSDDKTAPITPDTTPPRVVSTSPADEAADVPVITTISATFSEVMEWSTFIGSTFEVKLDTALDGKIQYSGRTVTFTPSRKLKYNQLYAAVITDSVTDVAGNHLDSSYTWTFTTTIGEIMPMSVGNRWRFQVISFDSLLNPIDTSYDTILVVKDTVIQTETWFIDNKGGVCTNRTDGLWKLGTNNQPNPYFKFPAVKGSLYGGDQTISEVINVEDTSVYTPTIIGNWYYCYQYKVTTSDLSEFYRFLLAPNIGPIRIDRYKVGTAVRLAERATLIRSEL